MEEMELEDPLYELAYISCVGKTPRAAFAFALVTKPSAQF